MKSSDLDLSHTKKYPKRDKFYGGTEHLPAFGGKFGEGGQVEFSAKGH